jgi:hypothetical protein
MSEVIERAYPNDGDWKRLLSDDRQKKNNKEIEQSHRNDSFVDALLFTQFSDKSEILLEGFQLPESKNALEKLKQIRLLRNKLAHANEYAASPEQAQRVCAVVRDLLKLAEDVRKIGRDRKITEI